MTCMGVDGGFVPVGAVIPTCCGRVRLPNMLVMLIGLVPNVQGRLGQVAAVNARTRFVYRSETPTSSICNDEQREEGLTTRQRKRQGGATATGTTEAGPAESWCSRELVVEMNTDQAERLRELDRLQASLGALLDQLTAVLRDRNMRTEKVVLVIEDYAHIIQHSCDAAMNGGIIWDLMRDGLIGLKRQMISLQKEV